MGFKEMHREDALGTDQAREVLLQIGNGPNLVQLIEPLNVESPVAKQIETAGAADWRTSPCGWRTYRRRSII